MSKFSAYLKELLDGQGESISRIAKNAGLERTSIHKALKDERLLSYTALKKLMRYLQLTLPQVRELTMYYEMLLQGEDIFRLQEAVCGIMAELAQFHFSGGSGAGTAPGSGAFRNSGADLRKGPGGERGLGDLAV